MLEVFEPEALSYSTFFCPILLTLSAFRNPILTPLPLSGFLDSLHCVLIVPTPRLALSSDTTHASGGIDIFVRQGLSFSELSTSSISLLDPYSDYVGINISLNNSSLLSFLMCWPPLFAPPQRMAEPIPLFPPFFPPPEISLSWGTSIVTLPPLGLKRYFPPPRGGSIRLGHLL